MSDSTISCPFCGEEILAVAKKCKHCKSDIENTVQPESVSLVKSCPFCGEEILAVAKKCKHCKSDIDVRQAAEPAILSKSCPFCGEEILAAAMKCKHCNSNLVEATLTSMPISGLAMPGTEDPPAPAISATPPPLPKMPIGNVSIVAAPAVKSNIVSGTTGINALIEILKDHHSSFSVTKGFMEDGHMDIWILDQIPANELEDARKSYAAYSSSNEKPLLLVNKQHLSNSLSVLTKAVGVDFTGLLITDKTIWYAVKKNGFLASFQIGTEKGAVRLSDIRTLAIQDHDHAYGTSYVGHEIAINGNVIGLLRMGRGMMFNENMLNYLESLFSSLTQSGVFSNIK